MASTRTLLAVALAAALVGSLVGAGVSGLVGTPAAEADPSTDTDGLVDGDPNDGSAGDGWTGDDWTDDRNGSAGDGANDDLVRFESKSAFEQYLLSAERRGGNVFSPGLWNDRVFVTPEVGDVALTAQAGGDGGSASMSADVAYNAETGASQGGRHSETNVQEQGIQEPDIVKTDGEHVYYGSRFRPERWMTTSVIDASSPASPTVTGDVPVPGRLLLANDTLVVLNEYTLVGYDVSDPDDPDRMWSRSMESQVTAARLMDGRIYLVTETQVDVRNPCPIYPLGTAGPEIACSDVYHPRDPASAEVTYTVMSMDPDSGNVSERASFVGGHDTATYVSENAVYLTYTDSPSYAAVYGDFLLNHTSLLDEQARDRIRRLQSYDLSTRAERVELGAIVDDWIARAPADEREELRKDLNEDWTDYTKANRRDLQRTGVVRVAVDGANVSMDGVGHVPGTPLNQWSMDEHEGHLRIATTVRAYNSESVNDVYVLDETMNVTGSVKGMGETERIYAVRFMEEQAYVVTFRQVDPFYVIDMSETGSPELQGEVKLPGFSRYLHPLGNDTVLGIGEENGKVKAVTFDVSDPTDPTVKDSRVLDARWSAVARTHHAFLQDPRHEVFFLPTSRGGYVYSYADGLERVKTVETDGPARRALYIDDYLYVFGEHDLTVVDETDWTVATRIHVR